MMVMKSIPAGAWFDVYAEIGVAVGTALEVGVESTGGLYVWEGATPPVSTKTGVGVLNKAKGTSGFSVTTSSNNVYIVSAGDIDTVVSIQWKEVV